MKRPSNEAAAPGVNDPFPDSDWLKRFPSLCPFLADFYWDDGECREPCSLAIKVQDGLILVSLQDRALERGLYRTGKDVKGALEAIEKALGGGGADWRPWKVDYRSQRKKG